MSDWPALTGGPPGGVIGSFEPMCSSAGQVASVGVSSASGSTWPSANLAVYVPFFVSRPVTVFQIAVQVTTQSGNLDVGLYDEAGARLVSSGSTAVAAAGLQALNITDTALSPGGYLMAMAVDNATAAFARANLAASAWRAGGVRQQASAFALPTTATFANYAQAYLPQVALATVATI